MALPSEAAQPRERWHRLWTGLGARTAPEGEFHRLVEAYGQPHRAYHSLAHVLDCLAEFSGHSTMAEHPAELETAIWFHDVVYDPRRSDNEARSADWAAGVLQEYAIRRKSIRRVCRLILATRHPARAESMDEKLILDVDLSILGRSPDEFQTYERGVSREYAWVPEAAYHRARAELLRAFLDRDSIYETDVFRGKYEAQARANLERCVAEHLGRIPD